MMQYCTIIAPLAINIFSIGWTIAYSVRILPSDTHISRSGGSEMHWLTTIPSCKYLDGHYSGSLGPFHASHIVIIIYHSETSTSSPLIIPQSHFKTWSRGSNIYYYSFQVLLVVSPLVFSHSRLLCFLQSEYQPASPQSFVSLCSLLTSQSQPVDSEIEAYCIASGCST